MKINDFIGHYIAQKILQAGHGNELDDKILQDYYKNNIIQMICSGIRKPTTNGVVEVVQMEIKNSLLAE